MSQTPAIRISRHQHQPHPQTHEQPPQHYDIRQNSHFPSLATSEPPHALPMAIPNYRQAAPPPLPPPTDILPLRDGKDLGWQWGNDANASDFGRPASVKLGSSLLGTPWRHTKHQWKEDEPVAPGERAEARRGSSISTVTPGRDHDMTDAGVENPDDIRALPKPVSDYGLRSERQLGQWNLEQTSKSYDTQLLSRIGGPNDSKRQSLSGSIHDLPPLQPSHSELERRHSSLRPLTVPGELRHGSIDSPTSWRVPSSGPISPAHTAGFWSDQGSLDSRSALSAGTSATLDDSSHKGSYDQAMFVHDDFGSEEGQMSTLHIHDRSPGSPKAGSKRRASSPPREREDRSSVSSASGNSDFYQRRSVSHLPNRGSPIRYAPNQPCLSSASSFSLRHGSLGSSLGVSSVPSSATSYASGRISPCASALTPEGDIRSGSSYNISRAVQPTSGPLHHHRTHSESMHSGGTRKLSADTAAHARHASFPHIAGIWVCECCPKKPKKFDSEESLRSHESEKQYTCAYCPNRFKNKNEAERHQTSLHLRPQSWSCGVLVGPEAAFHSSAANLESDICGYCGCEFPNPPQWDVRADHLTNVHKYRDCSSKKFFRADHFRQHLKHSHQGTSGKWTNTLENACMADEAPVGSEHQMGGAADVTPGSKNPALVITATATSNPASFGRGSGPPKTIQETPHDS